MDIFWDVEEEKKKKNATKTRFEFIIIICGKVL